MPEPIEYQAILNLQQALQGISVAAGYHFTVTGTAVKLDPNEDIDALVAPSGPRPFLILEIEPEAWQYLPALELRLTQAVRVHWIHDSDPTVDTSKLRTYLRGCADVEKAIAVDVTRGGLAVDTRIVRRVPERAIDGGQVWAMVELEILLHRTYGVPNG